MLPLCSRKLLERQQILTILGQAACDGLGIFGLIGGDEAVKGLLGRVSAVGLPYLVQCSLGLRLQALGEQIEHVSGFVHIMPKSA